MSVQIRSKYTGRQRVALDFAGDPGVTKQSFREECDINVLLARYDRTGMLPQLVAAQPQYGDFSDVPTFQEALDTVMRAETAFAALPAAVRAECENDPAVFLERVQDPEWALKHELALPQKEAPAPSSAAAASPPTESAAPASPEGAQAKASGKARREGVGTGSS